MSRHWGRLHCKGVASNPEWMREGAEYKAEMLLTPLQLLRCRKFPGALIEDE